MTNTPARIEKPSKNTYWFTGVAWVFVFVGFLAAGYGIYKCFKDSQGFGLNNLGLIGSFFQGSVASIWSLAGLMFIYVAFLEQRKQVTQQDAELEAQKQQFQIQHESIKKQNFESAFFQLLNLHNQLVNGMEIGKTGTHYYYVGKSCFPTWRQEFDTRYRVWLTENLHCNSNEPRWLVTRSEIKNVTTFYESDFFKTREAQLGPYFRNLYHLFKFVADSDITNKRRYTSLARAQLSNMELFFLFYNCLSEYGEGFKKHAEDFGIFEHLPETTLIDKKHKELFDPKAFN